MHGLSFCILWTEYHLHQEDRHTKHCYHDLFSPLTNICLLSPSFPTEIGKGATYTTSSVKASGETKHFRKYPWIGLEFEHLFREICYSNFENKSSQQLLLK